MTDRAELAPHPRDDENLLAAEAAAHLRMHVNHLGKLRLEGRGPRWRRQAPTSHGRVIYKFRDLRIWEAERFDEANGPTATAEPEAGA